MMNRNREFELLMTRRQLFGRTVAGIGTAALGSLLSPEAFAAAIGRGNPTGAPHFAPKAKRVICMHQGGAPSHLDLFDSKPQLEKRPAIDLPTSISMVQHITG